jgi:hypothetical protein
VPREEAILKANQVRLRPILMTTMLLVVSMIPIALGQGPGAGGRASMAKVIIGGHDALPASHAAGHPGRLRDLLGRLVRKGIFRRKAVERVEGLKG